MAQTIAEQTLDLTDLLCPLPVLKARKKLLTMPSGAILTVIATDPMAALDIPHFCQEQGHIILEQTQSGKNLNFRIKRK